MSDKMKKVIFAIFLFCIVGIAFSDSIVPSVVNGPFEVTLEFKNQTDKLDVVILLPKDWAIGSYNYIGGKLVNEEIEIVNISGNKAVGVHFSFENVSYLSLNVKVIPTNSGKLMVYYIFPSGFSKEVYKVNVSENKVNLLIPILLMVLPPASYFLIERNKSRIKEKTKRKRRRRKK